MATTITKYQLRQMIKEAVLKEQTFTHVDGRPLKPFSQHQKEVDKAFHAVENINRMFQDGDFEPGASEGNFSKEENIAFLKEEIATLIKFVKAYEAGF